MAAKVPTGCRPGRQQTQRLRLPQEQASRGAVTVSLRLLTRCNNTVVKSALVTVGVGWGRLVSFQVISDFSDIIGPIRVLAARKKKGRTQ